MTDCIFCKIIDGQIPTDMVYTDDNVVVFHDINSLAPVHLLIVTREHIPSLNDVTEQQIALIMHMTQVARQMAKQQNIDIRGYRLVINCGPEGGQVVPHLHMHLIGGRQLTDAIG